MPVYKFTAAFSQTTAISTPQAASHRTGGWSESWYATVATIQALIAQLTQGSGFGGLPFPGPFTLGWLPARAALLGIGAAINKLRIQQVSPLGPSQSLAVSFPGQVLAKADIPQMAIQCTCPALGANNVKRFTLRGVPDDQVIEGEAQFGMQYAASVRSFLNSLTGLQFFARDLSQPTFKVISIALTGLVTCEAAHTLNLMDMVRVLRTRESTTGKLRGGRYQVTGIGPLSNQFTLGLWNFQASTGGKVRKDATIYANADGANANPDRVIVKKVGRPSGGYRGRRSKKP